MAVTECEIYCASKKACRGCSKTCNKTCQWNAITDCEEGNRAKNSIKQSTSQKPGKNGYSYVLDT